MVCAECENLGNVPYLHFLKHQLCALFKDRPWVSLCQCEPCTEVFVRFKKALCTEEGESNIEQNEGFTQDEQHTGQCCKLSELDTATASVQSQVVDTDENISNAIVVKEEPVDVDHEMHAIAGSVSDQENMFAQSSSDLLQMQLISQAENSVEPDAPTTSTSQRPKRKGRGIRRHKNHWRPRRSQRKPVKRDAASMDHVYDPKPLRQHKKILALDCGGGTSKCRSYYTHYEQRRRHIKTMFCEQCDTQFSTHASFNAHGCTFVAQGLGEEDQCSDNGHLNELVFPYDNIDGPVRQTGYCVPAAVGASVFMTSVGGEHVFESSSGATQSSSKAISTAKKVALYRRKQKAKAVPKPKCRPRKRNNQEWVKVRTFNNAEDAEAFRCEEKWSWRSSHNLVEGRKRYLRCPYATPSIDRKDRCPCERYLFYPVDSEQVDMYWNKQPHRHKVELGGMRGQSATWQKLGVFADADAANAFVKEERWLHSVTYNTAVGRKWCLRCPLGSALHTCPTRRYLLFKPGTEEVELYWNCQEHMHNAAGAMTEATKGYIHGLFHSGIRKPRFVLEYIRRKGLPEPTLGQIVDYIKILRHMYNPVLVGQLDGSVPPPIRRRPTILVRAAVEKKLISPPSMRL